VLHGRDDRNILDRSLILDLAWSSHSSIHAAHRFLSMFEVAEQNFETGSLQSSQLTEKIVFHLNIPIGAFPNLRCLDTRAE